MMHGFGKVQRSYRMRVLLACGVVNTSKSAAGCLPGWGVFVGRVPGLGFWLEFCIHQLGFRTDEELRTCSNAVLRDWIDQDLVSVIIAAEVAYWRKLEQRILYGDEGGEHVTGIDSSMPG